MALGGMVDRFTLPNVRPSWINTEFTSNANLREGTGYRPKYHSVLLLRFGLPDQEEQVVTDLISVGDGDTLSDVLKCLLKWVQRLRIGLKAMH